MKTGKAQELCDCVLFETSPYDKAGGLGFPDPLVCRK